MLNAKNKSNSYILEKNIVFNLQSKSNGSNRELANIPLLGRNSKSITADVNIGTLGLYKFICISTARVCRSTQPK